MGIRRTCLMVAWFLAPPLWAGDLEIKGRLQTGAEIKGFKSGETYHDGRLEIETDRKKGYKGIFEISADSRDNEVVPLEALIDYKFEDGTHLSFGQQKTRLGLEYLYSSKSRLTVDRNKSYEKLSFFGYAGRQINLVYYGDGHHFSGFTHSVGYSEANDASLMSSYRHDLGSNWGVGAWGLLFSDRIDAGRQEVWATVLGLWQKSESTRFEWEILSGQDPKDTEFQARYGDGRKIYFSSNKLLYGWTLWNLSDGKVEGVLSQTIVVHDVQNYRYNVLSGLVGLNYLPHKDIRFAFNVDLVGANSRIDVTRRSYDESRIHLEAKYYW